MAVVRWRASASASTCASRIWDDLVAEVSTTPSGEVGGRAVKALGLTVPRSLIARADEVLE
jgi:hypothetical protein